MPSFWNECFCSRVFVTEEKAQGWEAGDLSSSVGPSILVLCGLETLS